MRARIIRAGLVLATVVALFAWGGPAGAQEAGGGPELTHEAEECIKLLEEGNDVDACQEAPSPILPPVNELIWGSLSFIAILVLLWKFALPGVTKGMNARTDRIRADLESAEQQRQEAETVLQDHQQKLGGAKEEAGRIIEEARQTADQVRSERVSAVESEISEMRRRAANEIEASKAQAIAELRGEITALALGAAERVVERNLDDATNRALIDSYIDSVGAGSR